SSRYIPARQLPDKAVSLLDTACARVAISQSSTPAMIEDVRVAIAARGSERAALVADSDLGVEAKERIAEIDTEVEKLKQDLAGLEAEWTTEQALVGEIRSLREIINPKDTAEKPKADAGAEAPLAPDSMPAAAPAPGIDEARRQIRAKFDT